MDLNRTTNPLTGRQWDLNSLIEKLLEIQDALLQAQEVNITLSLQIRELEKQTHDLEDLKVENDNQAQILADKNRENRHLHQELSRLSALLGARVQEIDGLKATIAELQHQVKTSQADRDLLAVMLTEAEQAAKQPGTRPEAGSKKDTSNWTKYLKGK